MLIKRFVAAARHPVISRLWTDQVIALAIFAFAAFWSIKFVASGSVSPQFYQRYFAPAVMEACGKGFVSPKELTEIPGLTNFLRLEQVSFSCDNIPVNFDQTSLTLLQSSSRYLMGAVALNWKLTGVSWSGLYALYALFFGLSIVAVYGVFRLGMGRPLAICLAILMALSPLQLNNLIHLRDYAKAPFIFTLILILGCLVKYPVRPGKTILLGAFAGMVLGVGIGFRMDLLIFIPAVLATLAAFTPSGFKHHLRARLVTSITFIFFCSAAGWPILLSFGGGANTFHVILLGLFTPFDHALNIQPSTVYEWGYLYNDTYVHTVLNSYAHRLEAIDLPVQLATETYDRIGGAYYFEILRHFPADIATRFIAATLKISQLSGLERMPPWFTMMMPVAVLISLCIIATFSRRIAFFSALAFLYLSGYPSLQFNERHYFHLQILPLFFIGLLGQQLLRKVYRPPYPTLQLDSSGGRFPHIHFSHNAIKRIGWFLTPLLISVCFFFFLRLYQQVQVSAVLENYEQLQFGKSDIIFAHNEDGTLRLLHPAKSNISNNKDFPLQTDYWGLLFDGSACGRERVSLEIKYHYSDPFLNFSRLVTLDIRTPLVYMFTTYNWLQPVAFGEKTGVLGFSGIDIEKKDLSCIKKFTSLKGFEHLPLLMNITLREGWKNENLYQTIGREHVMFNGRRVGTSLITFPDTLSMSHKEADKLIRNIHKNPENIFVIDKAATSVDNGISIKGDAPDAYAYVLQLPIENSNGELYLVAEGDLIEGGLTLGLLKDNRWAGQINITSSGKFKIIMKPDPGKYTVTLAHNVPGRKFNNFKLLKLGWTSKIE